MRYRMVSTVCACPMNEPLLNAAVPRRNVASTAREAAIRSVQLPPVRAVGQQPPYALGRRILVAVLEPATAALGAPAPGLDHPAAAVLVEEDVTPGQPAPCAVPPVLSSFHRGIRTHVRRSIQPTSGRCAIIRAPRSRQPGIIRAPVSSLYSAGNTCIDIGEGGPDDNGRRASGSDRRRAGRPRRPGDAVRRTGTPQRQ